MWRNLSTIFRETVEAQLRSQDQRLVSLVSAMQRGMERINELKGQLLEPLFRKLISMALSSTSVHFAKVIAMIDEMPRHGWLCIRRIFL